MEKRKRGKKNSLIADVHTGNLVSEKIKQLRLSNAEVARKISRPRSAISPLLKRPSMQCYLLWELSIALDYDFFDVLSAKLSEKTAGKIFSVTKQKISSLEKEIETLKKENEFLKEIVRLKK